MKTPHTLKTPNTHANKSNKCPLHILALPKDHEMKVDFVFVLSIICIRNPQQFKGWPLTKQVSILWRLLFLHCFTFLLPDLMKINQGVVREFDIL